MGDVELELGAGHVERRPVDGAHRVQRAGDRRVVEDRRGLDTEPVDHRRRQACTVRRIDPDGALGRRRADQRGGRGDARSGGDTGVVQDRGDHVDGLLRHEPVLGELAAGDGDQGALGAGGVLPAQDDVLAGQVGGGTVGRVVRELHQRTQPGVGAGDVRGREIDLQGLVDDVEDEADVGVRHLGDVRDLVGAEVLVGDADVAAAELLGEDEAEAGAVAGDRDGERAGGVADLGGVDDQMGAAGGTHRHLRLQVTGPYAGGVDDGAGLDLEGDGSLLQGVLQGDVAAGGVGGDVRGAGVGQHAGTVAGGGADEGGDQAGVVDELAVIVDVAEPQVGGLDGGAEFLHPLLRHGAGQGQGLPGGAGGEAEEIAAEEAEARQDLHRQRITVLHRRDLRQRAGEVRGGDLHEDAPLLRRALRDADIAGGEVAQATVGQFRGPAGGAEGDVVGVDEEDVEAAGRGVQGDPRTGHPRADDDEVDPLRALGCVGGVVAEFREVPGPSGGVEAGGVGVEMRHGPELMCRRDAAGEVRFTCFPAPHLPPDLPPY